MSEEIGRLSHDEQLYAITTWLYLRLAMVVIVVGLDAAILFEWSKVKSGCLQTSISAYYYTPVHGYFVGALVGIGVCLFCLKGNTYAEDAFLNLAGMFAPLVALVPTPDPGTCMSVLATPEDRGANIANNVTALLVVGFLALSIPAVLAARNRPARPVVFGYAAVAFVWTATALFFWLARDFFIANAHYTAAVLMFTCILVVVGINAVGYKEKTNAASSHNRYAAIGVAMGGSALVIGIAGGLGWAHWIIALETALITIFAVFWVIQTVELRHDGLR